MTLGERVFGAVVLLGGVGIGAAFGPLGLFILTHLVITFIGIELERLSFQISFKNTKIGKNLKLRIVGYGLLIGLLVFHVLKTIGEVYKQPDLYFNCLRILIVVGSFIIISYFVLQCDDQKFFKNNACYILGIFSSGIIIELYLRSMYMFQYGLIWIILPMILVFTNDIMAYFCGKIFGKHSLIVVSPNKTWEGFIGAFICTTLIAIFLGRYLMTLNVLTCRVNPFSKDYTHCSVPFLDEISPLSFGLKLTHIDVFSIVIGLFASTLTVFGGLFGSLFKRAFDFDDFGHSIPGHGGFTDRLDCVLVMIPIVEVFFKAFVLPLYEHYNFV
eukprot:TRINITY_DN22_c0_g1_i1.p1 TRINITY_DN22_c0_g1~~TRINITY_DN22_c0_g1_i1.p1  ORF type:complete len:341 (+),score=81.28 TRINITY_DN22_c0_g1_i1:37-1023(+)